MISTPKTGLASTASVMEYHRDALDRDREASRTEGLEHEHVCGIWGGRGAELAGFKEGSEIKAEDFKNMLDGRIGGQEVARGQRKQADGSYKAHHAPGTDFTFSPDKTLSVLALHPEGDPRLLALHATAVTLAMKEFEDRVAFATVREGGERHQVATGNLAWAEFMHTASRPVAGVVDPQLHTHVVILGVTHLSAPSLQFKENTHDHRQADHYSRRALDDGVSRIPGIERARGIEPPEPLAGMRNLSELPLVRYENRAEGLLSRDAFDRLGQEGQARAGVRREAGSAAQDAAGRGGEGRWVALDDKALYKARRDIDQAYNRHLAAGLKELGYEFTVDKHGNTRIKGFEQHHIDEFSGRRQAILEKAGPDASAADRQRANLATREDKLDISFTEFQSQIALRAAAVGLDVRSLSRAPEQQRAQVHAIGVEQKLVGAALDHLVDKMKDQSQQSLVPRTEKDMIAAIQVKEPLATVEQAKEAIAQAVAKGSLHRLDSGLLSVESPAQLSARKEAAKEVAVVPPVETAQAPARERAQAPADVREALVHNELSHLLDQMQNAVMNVASLDARVKIAQEAGLSGPRMTQLENELKDARRLAAGMNEFGMSRVLRERVESRLDEIHGKHSRDVGYQADIAAVAAKLGGAEVAARPRISNEMIAKAIESALTRGDLHVNVGKLSVETEAQTDLRLKVARSGKQAAWEQKRKESSAEFKAKRNATLAAKAAERKATMEQKREDFIKMKPAEVQAYLRNPLLTKSTRMISGAARNVAYSGQRIASAALRRPVLAAALLVTEPARLLARPVLRYAGKRLVNLIDSGINASAVGTLAAGVGIAQGLRAIVDRKGAEAFIAAQVRENFGKHAVVRLSTLGYSTNQYGEVTRIAFTLKNAPLVAAAMLLSPADFVARAAGRVDSYLAGKLAQHQGKLAVTMPLKLVAGAVRYALATAIAVQAMRNFVISQVKVVRAGKLDAALTKIMHKAVAAGRREIAQYAMKKFEGWQQQRADALKATAMVTYVKAEQAYLAGKIDRDSFAAVHAKTQHAIEKAQQAAHDRHNSVLEKAGEKIAKAQDRLTNAAAIADKTQRDKRVPAANAALTETRKVEHDKVLKSEAKLARDLRQLGAALPPLALVDQKKALQGELKVLDTRIAAAQATIKQGFKGDRAAIAQAKEVKQAAQAERQAVKMTLEGVNQNVSDPKKLAGLEKQETELTKRLESLEKRMLAGQKDSATVFDHQETKQSLAAVQRDIKTELKERETSTYAQDQARGRVALLKLDDTRELRKLEIGIQDELKHTPMAQEKQVEQAKEAAVEPAKEAAVEPAKEVAKEAAQEKADRGADKAATADEPVREKDKGVDQDGRRESSVSATIQPVRGVPARSGQRETPANALSAGAKAKKSGERALKELRREAEDVVGKSKKQERSLDKGQEQTRSRGLGR